MRLIKIAYITMLAIITSIFVGLYIAGLFKGINLWWCLAPIALLVRDFLKDVKYRTPYQEATSQAIETFERWHPSTVEPEPERVELFTDLFMIK